VRKVHDFPHGRLRGGEPQRSAGALRAGVPADQRPKTGAVDGRHSGEVDNEMFVTATYELAKLALEGFRCTARQERLAG
jgi:hypothetical protein